MSDGSDEERTLTDESPGTGDAAVDAVLDSLTRLDELPVIEHVAVFEAAHGRLQAALAGNPGANPSADGSAGPGAGGAATADRTSTS